MATISMTVTQGGAPLVGAIVTFGDVASTGLVTDAAGTVSATVAADFKVFVGLTIEHASLPTGQRDFGSFLFEAGEEYTFAL